MRLLVMIGVLAMTPGWQSAAAAASCPVGAEVRFESAATVADVGSSGLGHGIDLGTLDLGMTITACAGSTPGACGPCAIEGPRVLDGGRNRRCSGDVAIQCNTDAQCGAAGPCRLFASPPGPAEVSGADYCALNEITGPITGTVNPDDGTAALTIPLRSTPHLQSILAYRPCPTCDAGVCNGGPRDGLPCVADAGNPTYGATSFDCPPITNPNARAIIDHAVLLSTAVQTRTLGADSPGCRDTSAGPKCFCDTCDDAAATPCASNADCVAVGATVCGGKRCIDTGVPCATDAECPGSFCNRPGKPTEANTCLEGCELVSGDSGQCVGGPYSQRCAAPESHRECSVTYEDVLCPLTQTCDGLVVRACFLDNGVVGGSVTVSGSASPPVGGIADVALGLLTCGQYEVTGGLFSAPFGLPGLIRLRSEGVLRFSPEACPPEFCPPPTLCPSTPASCHAPLVAAKTTLQIRDAADDAKDQLAWRWRPGDTTLVSDFGDPVAADGYDLCLYDQGTLVARTYVPPAGLCGGKPCWRSKTNGFAFKNADPAAQGAAVIGLKAGTDGKASITFKGRGPFLGLPALSALGGPLDVRLHRQGSGECWGATFGAPFDRLDPVRGIVKDRAD